MVAFLDDDDEWKPRKIELQLEKMACSSDKVGLIHCWMEIVQDDGVIQYCPELTGDIFKHTLASQPLGNLSTWLIKREILMNCGGFDESLPRGQDGDLLRRISISNEVEYVPEVLVRYHVDHNNQRLTRGDKSGIQNAIIGQKAKLDKFESELAELPRELSKIHISIACRYAQLKDWRNCTNHIMLSISIAPFSIRAYYILAKEFVLRYVK